MLSRRLCLFGTVSLCLIQLYILKNTASAGEGEGEKERDKRYVLLNEDHSDDEGATYASPKQYPWSSRMTNSDGYGCNAVRVSRKIALTAAHCIPDINAAKDCGASVDLQRPSESVDDEWTTTKVVRFIRHPRYSDGRNGHDIAILELATIDDPGRIALVEEGINEKEVFPSPIAVAFTGNSLTAVTAEWTEDKYQLNDLGSNGAIAFNGYANRGDSGGALIGNANGTQWLIGVLSGFTLAVLPAEGRIRNEVWYRFSLIQYNLPFLQKFTRWEQPSGQGESELVVVSENLNQWYPDSCKSDETTFSKSVSVSTLQSASMSISQGYFSILTAFLLFNLLN